MVLFSRILQSADLEEIQDFEQRKLAETVSDENERTLQSWHARWRRESLEHYLPMGWSFITRDPDIQSPWSKEGLLMGYFIAQPMVFLDGQTQSLWVEHVAYSSLKARDELCELAYKLCREKHFQRVYFPNAGGLQNSLAALKAELWHPQVLSVRTSKA